MNGKFFNGYNPTTYIKDSPKVIVKLILGNDEKRFYKVNNRHLGKSYTSLLEYFKSEGIKYITYYTANTTIYYEYINNDKQ